MKAACLFFTILTTIPTFVTMASGNPVKKSGLNGDASQSQSEDQIKAFETLTIEAPDGSIKASFIRAGAHVTNFYA